MTGIVRLAQRDVFYTAKEVASLNLISNGRLTLEVGAGWNRPETRHHGLAPAIRGAILNEQIRALEQIWTNDIAEFHGEQLDSRLCILGRSRCSVHIHQCMSVEQAAPHYSDYSISATAGCHRL